LNAVSLSMWQQIPGVLEQIENQPDVRVVVVSGAGDKAFVSGADISGFEKDRSNAQANLIYKRASEEAFEAFSKLTKPLIARIHGYCIGGGLAVALACDIRVASTGSRFGIPAAKLGLGYEYGGIKKLVDLVGPAFASEIMFTARQFDATQALQMGLINRAVDAAELDEYVQSMVQGMASNAPLTIKAAKRAIAAVFKEPGIQNLPEVDSWVEACFASADYAEGRAAFQARRQPRFVGH
jgi:enoyl-CoA hydratase/carnithine racemase